MIIGVGFLLFAPIDGAFKLFVLKELKGKSEYHKVAGMVSFPLETFEARDVCPQNTIPRLIGEEMGIDLGMVRELGFSREAFHLIPGRADITTFYGFGVYAGDPNGEFSPTDTDIAFAGWMTPEELLGQYVRIEVGPILGHFLNNFYFLLNEQK